MKVIGFFFITFLFHISPVMSDFFCLFVLKPFRISSRRLWRSCGGPEAADVRQSSWWWWSTRSSWPKRTRAQRCWGDCCSEVKWSCSFWESVESPRPWLEEKCRGEIHWKRRAAPGGFLHFSTTSWTWSDGSGTRFWPKEPNESKHEINEQLCGSFNFFKSRKSPPGGPTCVCVRPREAASSARSGRAKYCVFWNLRWSAASWKLE